MRTEPLRRRVFVELGVILTVLAVLLSVVYLLASIRDDYIENNRSAQRALDAIEAEFSALRGKYAYIQQHSVLYKEVKRKQEAGELSINRSVVLEKFNQYKAQYGLNNLRLSVSPIQDIKDAAYTRKTSSVSASEVSVELDTLSDERVFELLDVMQQELSGVSKITRVTLSRERDLDQDVLNAIQAKGTYPLIKAGIRFTWYSINPIDTAAAVPNAGR